MKLLANSPKMVNSKMRILWSVRQGHCLIASGSPSQQTGRHRVDTGICGISIGANRHIHSFVPHGLWSIHYVPVLWSLRGGLITEGWSDPEDLLEEEDWNKGKERPEGHRWRRGLECPELPYKMLWFISWGFPAKHHFSHPQSPGGQFDSQGSSWAVRWAKTSS